MYTVSLTKYESKITVEIKYERNYTMFPSLFYSVEVVVISDDIVTHTHLYVVYPYTNRHCLLVRTYDIRKSG